MTALELSNLTVFVIKPTIALVVMLVVYLGLRRASAATRHLTLSLGLAAMVVVPPLSVSLPSWPLPLLPGPPAAVEVSTPAHRAPASGLDSTMLPVEGTARSQGADTALAAVPVASSTRPVTRPASRLGGGSPLLLVWLAGCALVLTRIAAGLLRMRWILHRGRESFDPQHLALLDACRERVGVRTRPRLVLSDRVDVPVVWGWFRPVLVVPREFQRWTVSRARVVLLHELAHLRRRDWPVLLAGRIVAALYWFHPLVWFVERLSRRECERACDDVVVGCGTRPSDYASHLLSIAQGLPEDIAQPGTALAILRRSNLNDRVRSILDPVLRRGAPHRGIATLAGVALVAALVPLAGVELATRAHAGDARSTAPDRQRSTPAVDGGAESEILLAQRERVDRKKKEKRKLNKLNRRIHADSEGEAAYKYAYELYREGEYDAASDAFESAAELGHRPATALYNAACSRALVDDLSGAMDAYRRAREAGWDEPDTLVEDSDFDPLRSDARFQEFVDGEYEIAGRTRGGTDAYPYRTTMERYRTMERDGSTDGRAWYKVGTRLLSFRELDTAALALERAVEHLGEENQNAMYNLACALSIAGRDREALDWLDRAVAAGFTQHERFLNDRDLDGIRDAAAFARIAETSEFLSLGRFPKRGWDRDDFSETRWEPAIADYRLWVAENPNSGRGWFNLGYALHYSRRFDEAIDAFSSAATLGYRPSTTSYNVACASALLGRTDAALEWLERAVDAGFDSPGHLKSDDDLDSLRSDPRFAELLERVRARHAREHRYEKHDHELHEDRRDHDHEKDEMKRREERRHRG